MIQDEYSPANLAVGQRRLLSLIFGSTLRDPREHRVLVHLIRSDIVVAGSSRLVKKGGHSHLDTSRQSSELAISRMDELAATSVRAVLIVAAVAQLEVCALVVLAELRLESRVTRWLNLMLTTNQERHILVSRVSPDFRVRKGSWRPSCMIPSQRS